MAEGFQLCYTPPKAHQGRLRTRLNILLDGEVVESQVLRLDDPKQRRLFAEQLVDRYGDQVPPADDLERRLLQIVGQATTTQASEGADAEITDGLMVLDSPDISSRRDSQADQLVAITADALLFHDPSGDTYARLRAGDHLECWPTSSRTFRHYLRGEYYRRYHSAPNGQAVGDALGVIQAKAHFDGPCHPVCVRVAPDGEGGLYVDLGDPQWRAVHVTATGWQVVACPPVYFRRSSGQLALPDPVPGENLDHLRRFVNVLDDDAWALIKAWLVAALCDRGPYPILALYGEQGSAKTTTGRMLRTFIDPATPELRSDPREMRDLAIAARANWLLAFDNVSHIQPWLSDALCRLATGGGWATRELYTDFDEALFEAKRPVLLNGISEFITRPDLLDRAIQVILPPIPDDRRRDEHELWAAFHEARPQLFGALLDVLAGHCANCPVSISTACRALRTLHSWPLPPSEPTRTPRGSLRPTPGCGKPAISRLSTVASSARR